MIAMEWKLPLFKMYWEQDDVDAVTASIKKGMFWAIGPEIQEFEKSVAEYVGRKYAIAFNSGTSALHVLMHAYGIKQNDEVIAPSFTFIATANAALFVGANPIFADIEERTYALTVKDVEKKITKNTKAIMPIHYGGVPAIETKALKELAEKHNLIFIEDAAEALGATIDKKKVASFGDSAILSFCSNKIISTGEGGMVVTDSKEIYEKLLLLRSHGRMEGNQNFFSSNISMDYVTLGHNLRMPTMCAALGLSQMKKIEKIIKMRQNNAKKLGEQLANTNITLPYTDLILRHVYQMYTIRFKDNKTREQVRAKLAETGIMSKIYFDPVHKTHFYKNELGYSVSLPVTDRVSGEVLSLPFYTHMTDEEIITLASALKKSM